MHHNLSCTFPVVHLKVSYCIKGIHLSSKDDNVFNEIEIEQDSLLHWINKRPIHFSMKMNEQNQMESFSLTGGSRGEVFRTDLTDNCSLSIQSAVSFGDLNEKNIKLQQKHIAIIKSAKKIDLSRVLDLIFRFNSFINMATLSQINFTKVACYSFDHLEQVTDKIQVPIRIEIYFKQNFGMENKLNSISTDRFLFKYHDIEAQFPHMIKKCFAFDHEMIPIFRHLIDSLEIKSVFRTGDFLLLVQAIEGFHRRFFDKTPTSSKKLELRIENLLKYFAQHIPILKDIDAQTVADSRNYYSHFYLKEDKMQIASGKNLIMLTSKLRQLPICCLLHELGLQNTEISKILRNHGNTRLT